MSTTANPLFDVTFLEDASYALPTSTDDVAAGVIDGVWGAAETPVRLDSNSFDALFNPNNSARVNYSYSVFKNFFAKGGSYVEAVRLGSKEQWLYLTIGYTDDDSDVAMVVSSSMSPYADSENFSTLMSGSKALGVIRYRYPGGPDGSVTITPLTLTVTGGIPAFKLSVTIAGVSVESHVVTFQACSVDGVSYFYADVLNSDSSYFVADANLTSPNATAFAEAVSGSEADIAPVTESWEAVPVTSSYTVEDYTQAYAVLSDRSLSTATLLLATAPDSATKSGYPEDMSSVYTQIMQLSADRMDCNSLIGLNLGGSFVWPSAAQLAEGDNVLQTNFVTPFASYRDKFSFGIAAMERFTVGGKTFVQDGTAGWAGRIAAVAASTQNRNQMPSYKAYGSYSGTLLKSLNFQQVVSIHEEGIGSIYSSASGNYIFDVRSLYEVQSGYFGKANVMRMVAVILRNTFNMLENVIHTDISANVNSRLQFQSDLNSMLGELKARSEIRSQSTADVGSELNSDANTNGGEYLNILLDIWFMKLTERARIYIKASDSTTPQVSIFEA